MQMRQIVMCLYCPNTNDGSFPDAEHANSLSFLSICHGRRYDCGDSHCSSEEERLHAKGSSDNKYLNFSRVLL